MSDTPRTDAAEFQATCQKPDNERDWINVVYAKDHRALERENARLREDAERWRFRWAFLNDGGAFMYGQGGRCMLYRKGECIAAGADEREAIDAALRSIPSEGSAPDA